MSRVATTAAIWFFGMFGVAIVTALIADRLLALRLDRIHDGPLGLVGQLCILVCLLLMARRRGQR